MGEATSPDQSLLRHLGERRQVANLDRGVGLVLVAIIRKRLNLSASLYEILQILSLTMFERTPLDQLLTLSAPEQIIVASVNQLNLFE